MSSRIQQLDRADLSDKQAVIHDEILSSRGNLAGPFASWLHSPQFADRAQKLGQFVRYQTSIHPRLSELAILVTARFWDCQLEWSLHEGIARDAELSPAVIDALRMTQYPEFERADEQIVYDFTSELLYNRFVQDRTYGVAVDELGEVGVVELIGLIGYYGMVAMTLNGFHVPMPDDVEPGLRDCPIFH